MIRGVRTARGRKAFAMALGLFLAASVQAVMAPSLRPPIGVQMKPVIPEMIRNGAPTSIWAFQSHMPIDEVMDGFEQRMEEAGMQPITRDRLGAMVTLGAIRGQFFFNVQGQSRKRGGGSAGFLMIGPRPGMKLESPKPNMPLPEDVLVISHEIYRDGNRNGEVLVGFSTSYAEHVGLAVISEFERAGWNAMEDAPLPEPGRLGAYSWMKKGDRLCRIATVNQGRGLNGVAVVSIICYEGGRAGTSGA